MKLILAVSFVLLALCAIASADPIWKVFCSGQPLLRGRLDPIVAPGKVAGHLHKIHGASNFNASFVGQAPLDYYNNVIQSTCTTCSISKVDLSQYWHPDLYYQWPNGTFSLVPNSGLTVYYLSRSGNTGTQASNPNWQAIPKGLRMLAGSPMRRTFNATLQSNTAVSYVCLSSTPANAPEINKFPTDQYFCASGLRAQVFFPMCWDGVNLDSADHASHMAYPTNYNGGDCPSTHPVRIPGVFFEALYSVASFPHGNGVQPFVWSCGDPTGYGFHGDFLSGWDPVVMQAAIQDPSCDLSNPALAIGNNVSACAPLGKYVQQTPQGACQPQISIPITEDYGMSHVLPKLPGCNLVYPGPGTPPPCTAYPSALSPSTATGLSYLIKSVATGQYLTGNQPWASMACNVTYPTQQEIWGYSPVGSVYSLQNAASGQYASASGPNSQLQASRGSVSTWETFTFVPQGSFVAIQSLRNNKYCIVASDGTLSPSSSTITNACLFLLETPNGGALTNAAFPVSASVPLPVVPVPQAVPVADLPYTVILSSTIYGSSLAGSGVSTDTGVECWNLCASTAGCCAAVWDPDYFNGCYMKDAPTAIASAAVVALSNSDITVFFSKTCAATGVAHSAVQSDSQDFQTTQSETSPSGLSSGAFIGIGIAVGIVSMTIIVVIIAIVVKVTKKQNVEEVA